MTDNAMTDNAMTDNAMKWAPQDSNLGPTGYEPAALTAELGALRSDKPLVT